jgi:hypothetical protein
MTAVTLALLFWTAARAQSPADAAAAADETATDETATDEAEPAAETAAVPPTPSAEVTVYGDIDSQRRRSAVIADLRRQGYREGRRSGDHVVFRPEVAWHPSVVVYDGGYVVIKRSPVRFEPYIKGDSKLRWLGCIPPFGLMCIKASGLLVSDARLNPRKGEVAAEIDAELDQWQASIAHSSTDHRVNLEVPAMLEACWTTGAPIDGQGPSLATPADRRQAILTFWATRADTPEGELVRNAVESFLAAEIQSSPFPVTAAEIAAAHTACACSARLSLAPMPLDEGGPGE